MEWRPVLLGVGGVAGFAAVAGVGALAIVSLAPSEQPVAVGEKALLMESAPAAPVEAPPVPRPAPAPVREDLWSMMREAPAPAPTVVPPPEPPAPKAPRREAPRTIVAAAPTPQLPPEARAAPVLPSPLPRLQPRPEPRADGVLTPAEIRRFRLSLRLTREQEPYWAPVEQALVEIGGQQAAMVRAGQDPKSAFGIGTAMRMFSVARPLIDVLREDQKERVRAQARSMGFGSVASQI